MTSGQESSDRDADDEIECLGGVFHPHAIEVQEFSCYARVIDVRARADFDEDHVPGAVWLDPAAAGPAPAMLQVQEARPSLDLPPDLAELVSGVTLDQAILVYCGRGGLDSQPVARALRWRGWTVDVLPGGWINYRRWVQAGLEIVPRLVSFRAVSSVPADHVARVLQSLARVGEQVLDLAALAGRSQAGFESGVLEALRRMEARRPVWVGVPKLGGLVLPGGLRDALVAAPVPAWPARISPSLAPSAFDAAVHGWLASGDPAAPG